MTQNEPNSAQTSPALPPEERSYFARPAGMERPFWNYEDLAVFAFLMLPSLGVAWLLIQML
jgi:hypothetical protein